MNKILAALFFVALACGSESQLQNPDQFQLLNPEFLRRTSVAHQVAYHALQDEIDQAIAEINSMVALALSEVTSPTVGVYSTHATLVWNSYVANNAEIATLSASECRLNAYEGNDYAITSTGFRSSNCITGYNKNVAAEIAKVNEKLREISPGLQDVVLNVVRAYNPLSNPMLDGEQMERNINQTYVEMIDHWNTVNPDISAMRTSFVTNLNALGVTLGNCYNTAKTYMDNISNMVRDQVTQCLEYNGSRREQFIESLKRELMENAGAIEMFKFE